MGLHHVYARYLKDLGYEYVVGGNGNCQAKYEGDGAPPNHVALSTFHSLWLREYPWLKVSKRTEDICSECYVFRKLAQISC